MKQITGNLALLFVCIAMFTSESAWYIPIGFAAIGIGLLYLEWRLKR